MTIYVGVKVQCMTTSKTAILSTAVLHLLRNRAKCILKPVPRVKHFANDPDDVRGSDCNSSRVIKLAAMKRETSVRQEM